MANAAAGSGANADSADETDTAAARERELVARLTRRRAASGLSQARLARLMRTSQSAVARIESGQRGAKFSTLSRYAEALGLSLDLVEDAKTQAGRSSEEPSAEAASTPPLGQVSPKQPRPAAIPHDGAGPKGRPGPKPKNSPPAVVTKMPDQADPDHVLTWRQRKILQVIRHSVQERGHFPSMREIGEAVGLASTSSVAFQLSSLQRRGYLHYPPPTIEVRLPGYPPARPEPSREEDELAEKPGIDIPWQETACVPLIGRIAAGVPIMDEQCAEDVLPLPRQLVGEGTLFMLKVQDDAMIGAAIANGDWVVVRQPSLARDGDIIAADIGGETTVRTFKQSGGHVWLVPHHPAHTPIPGDKASILGRIVAVLRKV